jgi:hypothetical protein
MFVFGTNLPVAEILFVVLLLMLLALIIVIVQLVKMARHIRVLDETTLEIRRYEEAEEATLKPLEANLKAMDSEQRRQFAAFLPGFTKLERAAVKRLLAGDSPQRVRQLFLERRVREPTATRAVNSATHHLNRFTLLSNGEVRDVNRSMAGGAR